MVKSSAPVDIYVRISRVGKREHFISDVDQENRAREHAAQKGLTVGTVLADIDESGGKWERPGLQTALARVKAGESGGVIVAWLDRLSRDSEHAQRLVREIGDAGGSIYAPDAPSDWTTPEGELQANVFFMFAQYTRKRAKAGFARSQEQSITAGVPVNPRIAPGYERHPETRRLVIVESVARHVREVFHRRVEGAGPAELADYLSTNGVRTSMGSATWSKQAVYGVLSNRVYLGELRYGPEGHEFVNLAAHAPIIDRGTWEAAQRSHARKPAPSVGQHEPYLLTGLVRCASCRYALQATQTSKGKRIYRCTVRHAGGRCPAPARHDADALDALALAEFRSLVVDDDQWQPVADTARLDAAVVALAEAERREAEYRDDDELRETIGRASWLDGLAKRRERVEVAEAEIAAARAALPQSDTDPREVLRELDAMPTAQAREHLAAVVDCIALRPASHAGDRLAIFLRGHGPADLPRRGFKSAPVLLPFDLSPVAAVAAA